MESLVVVVAEFFGFRSLEVLEFGTDRVGKLLFFFESCVLGVTLAGCFFGATFFFLRGWGGGCGF